MIVRCPNSKDRERERVCASDRVRLNSGFEANDETYTRTSFPNLAVDPMGNVDTGTIMVESARPTLLSLSLSIPDLNDPFEMGRKFIACHASFSYDLQLYTTLAAVIVVGSTI